MIEGPLCHNLQMQASAAVTDVTQGSVWFIIVCCFFTVGSVEVLQLSFVIFVGEELTVFGFAKEECEKNFDNHWSKPNLRKLKQPRSKWGSSHSLIKI